MLNTEQKKAIEVVDKPLVVIAGPGTGKTTLITEKIRFLLDEKGYSEDEVLAITFTKKAAAEMSQRVEVLTNKPFFAKTFHEFAKELIDEYQGDIPRIDMDFTLIDETNQLLFFLENLSDFKLNTVEIKNNLTSIAYELQSSISKLKDFGVTLLDLEKLPVEDMDKKMDLFLAYSKYEQYKKENNYLDFSDLLLLVLDLLKKNQKIREEVSKRYKHVLVDEFQDTNKVQLEILKLIAKDNITIVGDQKQSIYAFRGANFSNLDDFKSHYNNYEEVVLHQNYRSSTEVLDNLNKQILDIGNREEKLECNFDEKGEFNLIEAQSENSQLSQIAKKISLIQDKEPDASIGVLCRRKSEVINVSNFMKSLGIKHDSSEVNNFFDQEIIKTVQNYLYILLNPKEANREIFRLLLDFGVRNESVRKIFRLSKIREKPILKILKEDNITDYGDEVELLKKVSLKIDALINLKSSKASLYDLIREMLFELGVYQRVLLRDDLEKILSLNNFLKFTKKYLEIYKNNDLMRFLRVCEHSKSLDLSFENEGKVSYVEVLTVHASKGKEFDYVFIPYLNDRRFPTTFKRGKFEILKSEDKDRFLEEERRLFFVATSRAKKGCELLYVKRYCDNKTDSKPSEFLGLFGLRKESADTEFDDLSLDESEQKRVEVIGKINNFLLNEEYGRARDEIKKLEMSFSTKKDLNYFFNDEPKQTGSATREDEIEVDFSRHIYSVSQVRLYETCPKKYMFAYVYKIPSTPKHYFDFGSSVHDVLERLVFDIGKFSKDVLFARGVSDLRKSWISKGYESEAQEMEYFDKGVRAIKAFIEKEIELGEEKREIESIEEKFVINIGGKRVMGFIDRIDKIGDDYEILDYKTSNSMESATDLKKNLQLFVYSVALKTIKGKMPKSVGLWYLIHDKIVKVDADDIDSKALEENMVKLIKGIESNEFKANPSFFNCKFCDYSKICPNSKL